MAKLPGDDKATKLINLTITSRLVAEKAFKTKKGKDYSLTVFDSENEKKHHLFLEWTCGEPDDRFTTTEYCSNTFFEFGLSSRDIMDVMLNFLGKM